MGATNKYSIPHSRPVKIGDKVLGASHQVLIQSMANTNTQDIHGSIEQFEKIASAGAQMIRYTTPSLKDVQALKKIVEFLKESYSHIPIIADVHFNAKIANEAAKICHKVRINPGNFSEKRDLKTEYSEIENMLALEEAKDKLNSLLDVCSAHETALRIGVNHGSLSERIMSRFGDTPEGMVESAMEFLRVCNEFPFPNVLVSLKSSNTNLMVQSVRLLVSKMLDEDLYFPLHLGVTESGDGLEGRIRSTVGIAPLLLEGMGDTIRISLTEAPENEIPVAKRINKLFPKPEGLPYNPLKNLPWDPFHFQKIISRKVHGIGGENVPQVVSSKTINPDTPPDIIASLANGSWHLSFANKTHVLKTLEENEQANSDIILIDVNVSPSFAASISEPHIFILNANNTKIVHLKSWMIAYLKSGGINPIILRKEYFDSEEEEYAIHAAGEFALLLIDHLLQGIWILNKNMTPEFNTALSFHILQAARNRFTATEYIACPSCGRTQFDIQTALSEVRKHTSHLKGLKIAVMGCIVNGPGEMADADYGYIGSGNRLVSIYKGKNEILKKVPEEIAINNLIDVIKTSGDWLEP